MAPDTLETSSAHWKWHLTQPKRHLTHPKWRLHSRNGDNLPGNEDSPSGESDFAGEKSILRPENRFATAFDGTEPDGSKATPELAIASKKKLFENQRTRPGAQGYGKVSGQSVHVGATLRWSPQTGD
jgi:hypothetical protein